MLRILQQPWRVGLALLTLVGVVAFFQVRAQDASASGEVRRVDAAGGKVTLIHGAIPELELPAMTLVYRAQPELLQGLQPGDKVKFSAKRESDKYEITAISK